MSLHTHKRRMQRNACGVLIISFWETKNNNNNSDNNNRFLHFHISCIESKSIINDCGCCCFFHNWSNLKQEEEENKAELNKFYSDSFWPFDFAFSSSFNISKAKTNTRKPQTRKKKKQSVLQFIDSTSNSRASQSFF